MKRFIVPAALCAALLSISPGQSAAKELVWAGCGITKKAFMQGLAEAYEQKSGVKINLQGGGATRGIRESAAKSVDMGGSCRFHIEGDPAEANAYFEPVAWDALVVIVHKDNPLESITLNEVRGLYTGKVKNWRELGGSDAPVELYVRNGKISGVGRTIRKLVFANYDMDFVAKHVVKSSGPLEKAVEENPYAVGITGISSARKRNVKVLKLENIEPSYDNIKTGDYLLYRPLYITYNQTSENRAEIERFIRFAHGREGKKILRNNNVVPYTDALGLVMKQVEQDRRARDMGLYSQ